MSRVILSHKGVYLYGISQVPLYNGKRGKENPSIYVKQWYLMLKLLFVCIHIEGAIEVNL
jgi:hypothetical protein